MNSIFGESDIKNNKNNKKGMKLVFANNSEKNKITEVVMNASSISNSRALIDLVKDSVVDGSEKEPEPVKEKEPSAPVQESMADLISRAQGMGVKVSSEDSRAGILNKIKEFEASFEKKEESKPEGKKEEKKGKDTVMKLYIVNHDDGIMLNGSDSALEFGSEFEADSESDEIVRFLESGAIEEVTK